MGRRTVPPARAFSVDVDVETFTSLTRSLAAEINNARPCSAGCKDIYSRLVWDERWLSPAVRDAWDAWIETHHLAAI